MKLTSIVPYVLLLTFSTCLACQSMNGISKKAVLLGLDKQLQAHQDKLKEAKMNKTENNSQSNAQTSIPVIQIDAEYFTNSNSSYNNLFSPEMLQQIYQDIATDPPESKVNTPEFPDWMLNRQEKNSIEPEAKAVASGGPTLVQTGSLGTTLTDSGIRSEDSGTRLEDSGTRLKDSGTRSEDSSTRLPNPRAETTANIKISNSDTKPTPASLRRRTPKKLTSLLVPVTESAELVEGNPEGGRKAARLLQEPALEVEEQASESQTESGTQDSSTTAKPAYSPPVRKCAAGRREGQVDPPPILPSAASLAEHEENLKINNDWGGECVVEDWKFCNNITELGITVVNRTEKNKKTNQMEPIYSHKKVECFPEDPKEQMDNQWLCLYNGWTVTRCHILCMSRCNKDLLKTDKWDKFVLHEKACKT